MDERKTKVSSNGRNLSYWIPFGTVREQLKAGKNCFHYFLLKSDLETCNFRVFREKGPRMDWQKCLKAYKHF